jgi:hypothetical protein
MSKRKSVLNAGEIRVAKLTKITLGEVPLFDGRSHVVNYTAMFPLLSMLFVRNILQGKKVDVDIRSRKWTSLYLARDLTPFSSNVSILLVQDTLL